MRSVFYLSLNIINNDRNPDLLGVIIRREIISKRASLAEISDPKIWSKEVFLIRKMETRSKFIINNSLPLNWLILRGCIMMPMRQ